MPVHGNVLLYCLMLFYLGSFIHCDLFISAFLFFSHTSFFLHSVLHFVLLCLVFNFFSFNFPPLQTIYLFRLSLPLLPLIPSCFFSPLLFLAHTFSLSSTQLVFASSSYLKLQDASSKIQMGVLKNNDVQTETSLEAYHLRSHAISSYLF